MFLVSSYKDPKLFSLTFDFYRTCLNFQGTYFKTDYLDVLMFSFKKRAPKRQIQHEYRKIASSNTSRLETHEAFFRLLMKRIFGPYVL